MSTRSTDAASGRGWNLLRAARWAWLLSALVILPGFYALVTQGLNFSIDFQEGTMLQVHLQGDPSVAQVREVLAGAGLADSEIQRTTDAQGQVATSIRTRLLTEQEQNRVEAALRQRFGAAELLQAASVGPRIAEELRANAIRAVLIGLVLQVIYIAWRFPSFRYGVAADLALLHDMLILLGIFAILRASVDASFIAVLLTLIGYSVNDTIVIFDRIRENLRLHTRERFDALVNRSILEVIVRSLTTSLGGLLAVVAIYFYGGITLRDFALGLAITIVTGSYSSIFIAPPILSAWQSWDERRRGTAAARATITEPEPATELAPAGGPAARRRATRRRR